MVVSVDRKLSLRVMAEKDIFSASIAWLNDGEVVQYSEQRSHHTTAGDVKSFIDKMAADPTELMCDIFLMICISEISSLAPSIASIKSPIYLI